jgi:AcrR family transcriptional regulator
VYLPHASGLIWYPLEYSIACKLVNMPEKVKSRRYESPRRAASAVQTKADIVAAAHRIFLADGYGRTTLRAVAEAAGVSLATVKAIFANKAGLVSAVRDVALAGDAETIPLAERGWYLAILAERDPIAKLRAHADGITGVHLRATDIHRLVRDAGASDEAMARLWRLEHEQRREEMESVARSMRSQGTLRSGLKLEAAVATMWVLSSPETYWLLTDIGGWPVKRYTRWLHRAMVDGTCEQAGTLDHR